MQWETVIGLEVHVQLKTDSKIFSGSSTKYGAEPNTQANIIDLGMPGVLPVLNKRAVQMGIKLGLATDSKINKDCFFSRKNYFYPDLPKGYQISQSDVPIIKDGKLEVTLEDGVKKTIRIHQAHLEEDAGKSLHEDFSGFSGIDLNRAGTPLLEIVSEPDMRSAKEAIAYLKTLHSLVCYLGICDGNMQEGSFRCDANISVRPLGQEKLGTRAEIKNVNSFKFVEKAINYEVERQIDLLENNKEVLQETRLYDSQKDETRSMRSKEDAHDYRYFPDPDLVPLDIQQDFIDKVKDDMPELPWEKLARFQKEYELIEYDARVLTSSIELANYYEEVVKIAKQAKLSANWVMGELLGVLNKNGLSIKENPISSDNFGQLIARIADNTISGKIAKQVFEAMWETKKTADEIIEEQGLKQVTDTKEIESLIDDVINNNPKQVEDYRGGKDKLFGFFVGQVMKLSKGKANPEQVNKILKDKL